MTVLCAGSRVVAAPTEEFLELAREHCAPGSTPARQLEVGTLCLFACLLFFTHGSSNY